MVLLFNMCLPLYCSLGAYEHLMAREPKSWCRALFASGKACEAVENGMSESFNSVIDRARKKPIITMLEEIQLYMMKRVCTMCKLHEKWEGDICPSILEKMEKFKRSLRYWNVFPSGGNCFEVRSGFEAYKVDIEGQYCTCRSWYLCGYPCLHACATFYSLHKSPESNVSFYFQKSKFVQAYKDNILPLNGSNMWEVTSYTKPLPPKDRRMPGRPTLKRKRHVSEKNDKSCKNPKQVPPPQEKKKKGRPKIVDETERHSRGGRSGRRARVGGKGSTRGSSGNIQQENMHNPVREETQQTEETMEVPMSMDQVFETQAEVDVEVVYETQIINDLRQCGYTDDELVAAELVAAELDEDGDEEGIDETQPPIAMKIRRPSERITKANLGKKIAGLGSASEIPLEIE